MKYKSIFISDIHLGIKYSRTDRLLKFLNENESEELYLVGDIVDGWALSRKFEWLEESKNIIQKFREISDNGTKVNYIIGNHDEFLRTLSPLFLTENMEIKNESEYIGINKKKYLIVHGDLFDTVITDAEWLAKLGDIGYDILLFLNHYLQYVRKALRYRKQWSLSKFVKDHVKQSVSFINKFENILSDYAHKNSFDGVICGHIHKAEIKQVEDIEYLNCGDWIESCTAIVETYDGEWKIINFLNDEEK